MLLKTTCEKGGAELKKKELMKRLSAISMAAMMTVTMIPSNAYAADELLDVYKRQLLEYRGRYIWKQSRNLFYPF